MKLNQEGRFNYPSVLLPTNPHTKRSFSWFTFSSTSTCGTTAIGGYDPVAYFTGSKPVKGTAALKYNWQGADWHFANRQNLDAFKAAPQKYAPQYGGYCAYGTSQGYKAPTEPDAWTVVKDKRYLNSNKKVKETWSKDQAGYIKKGDANWPTVAKQG